MDSLRALFVQAMAIPQAHAADWAQAAAWIHVLATLAMTLACVAIGTTLATFARRVGQVPFRLEYTALVLFIVSCGLTYFTDALVLWWPHRELEAGIRLVAALASVATAVALARRSPQMLALVKRVGRVLCEGSDGASVERLVQRQRELESALATARAERERAEQASEDKSELLSRVSHELRTPLTSIQLQLGRFRRSAATPEQSRMLERIERSSRRLLLLVESVMELNRIERGRAQVRREPCDVVSLLYEVIGELKTQASKQDLNLRVHVDGEVAPISTDSGLVRLALMNLVESAIRTTEDGAIDVILTGTDASIRVVVSERGPDSELDLQAELRGSADSESQRNKLTPGLAIGLALARGVARELGGKVELSGQAGSGSAFTLTLPADHRASCFASSCP